MVASKLVESFENGVWWVALASLSNPDLLPQAVASAIKVREVPGRTLIDALVEYLKTKDLLLILDTCGELLGRGISSLCSSLFLLPFPTEHKGERERHIILSLAHGDSYPGRTGASSMVRSATRSARMPPGTSCTTRMDTCS
jgi:predicted ATPase